MCAKSSKYDHNNNNNGNCCPHAHNHKHTYKTAKKTLKARTTTPVLRTTAGQLKWQLITISSIILLLCQTSHVLAIRKGRLMSPSSFTALSGDLHVQIQFSAEDVPPSSPPSGVMGRGTTVIAATTTSTTTSRTTGDSAQHSTTDGHKSGSGRQDKGAGLVESTITSTLVISKFIDDAGQEGAEAELQRDNDSSEGGEGATVEERLLHRKRKEIVQNIPLFPDPRHNVTQIAVPCQTFTRGGLYEMQVVTNLKTTGTAQLSLNASATSATHRRAATPTMTTTTLMPVADERLRQTLDVRWPSAEMHVSPVRLRTYPERPVEVTLRFPEVNCERAWRHAENLPEFWLELVYCGKERKCAQLPAQNVSKSSILYAEQVRGFPKELKLLLRCELFGLAGNYAVQLRPMRPAPNVPVTRRYLSVDWSDKFVFNVYARSIFPCDPHTGIGVLYEYPGCILEQGDRVRVYARLRADVASLKPPTSLHYVSEQRVVKSQYSLYFSCDLFTEKYVEYCFVYVSQAISGAVADVRMDCVPTLPVSDSDTGGWGPWSEWTPCSTNCLGGTRNRYRFCDSPPPRYGAKFCEGSSVQSEKCGKTISDTWDCIYETSGTIFNKANRTEVSQEIGPGCRCGCIVHLGSSKPKRIIAGATQSCPGRSFWLIQVDGEESIALSLNFLQLPCPSQYVKVRDGPSLSSTLLIELQGGGNNLNMPVQMTSTGAQLLVEFYAGDESAAAAAAAANSNNTTSSNVAALSSSFAACTGGFLANVEQNSANNTAATVAAAATTTLLASTRLSSVKSRAVLQKPKLRAGFTLVHISAVVFASIIILISAMLGAQYMVRYRKYHIAVARRRDEGSRLHTPCASLSSLQSRPPSRAMSTTTLLSEVIYLVKMRPKHQLRHSILRESVDAENLARETEFNERSSEADTDAHAQMAKCSQGELGGSTGSIVTLRNEIISPTSSLPMSQSRTPSIEDGLVEEGGGGNFAESPHSTNATLKRKESRDKDADSIISSGMSSICNSPPMNLKRLSRYSDRYDAVTLKIRNSRLGGGGVSIPGVGGGGDSITDCESPLSISMRGGDYERLSMLGSRSASASLTNGCYSPAASIISSATIRTTNPKESKEKQNRKRLLARPGSEFSLGPELELDYYDYNVINAGAAPGSYLGMDPAYLVWIPPFEDATTPDDGCADDDKTPEPEPDETEPLYEEIKMPKYGHYLSPGSNTESSTNTTASSNTSPTSDELSPLSSKRPSKATSPAEASNLRNCLIQQTISAASASSSYSTTKPATPYFKRKQRRLAKQQSKSSLSLLGNRSREEAPIAMRELRSSTRSARDITTRSDFEEETTATTADRHFIAEAESFDSDATMNGSYVEKETSVVKSPSDLQNFLALDDIQFADESESDHDMAKKGERVGGTSTSASEFFGKEQKRVDDMKIMRSTGGFLFAKSTTRSTELPV